MLTKLFRYEMRGTAKTFMWFYIAFAAIAVVNAFVNPFGMGSTSVQAASGASQGMMPAALVPDAVKGMFMALYGISIFVIAVVTIVIIILRFYRNLLGDEGYLLMTLPVTREQHILAKLLAAVIWSVCTTVLIFLSFLFLFQRAGILNEIVKGINELIANGAPVDRWIVQLVILLLVSCITGILMLYAAMGTGPNIFKNHRLGGSILAFIIIYVASQFVMLGVVWGMAAAIAIDPMMAQAGAGTGMSVNGVQALGTMSESFIANVNTFVWGLIIGTAAIGVVCWFLTTFMLKRKLNLA